MSDDSLRRAFLTSDNTFREYVESQDRELFDALRSYSLLKLENNDPKALCALFQVFEEEYAHTDDTTKGALYGTLYLLFTEMQAKGLNTTSLTTELKPRTREMWNSFIDSQSKVNARVQKQLEEPQDEGVES